MSIFKACVVSLLGCLLSTAVFAQQFSVALFTKTDPNGVPTPRKKRRNVIYYVCGVVILLCIAGMLLIGVFRSQIAPAIEDYAPVFWLESIAVLAFGFSWLVKGETLWQDEN